MSTEFASERLVPSLGSTGRILFEYFNLVHPLQPEQLRGDLSLDQLGIDSVEIPGLLHHVKREIGVEIEVGDVLGARTVSELVARIDRLKPRPARAAEPPPPRAARERFAELVNPHIAKAMRHMYLDRHYVRGEGLWLTDAEGRRVLDFTAQYGALPFGYNPPELWRAIERCRTQAIPSFAQMSALGPASELAEALLACAPAGLGRVTFVNSGAEAIEAAIKLCVARTGRSGILSTRGGFHGKTMGALSATGRAKYQRAFRLPAPGFDTVPFDDPAALERRLSLHPEHYAAFIVEPIQGEAGAVVPSDDYLLRARALCRRYGVLFVVDEVQTGLGRTGRMFATADEVEPDVLTVAKALSGGLVPIGATLCRPEVYTREFGLKHSSTFAGHGLGASIGLAVLALLRDPTRDVLGNVTRMSARLRRGLDTLAAQYPELVATVRGRGLMLGIELRNLRERSSDSLLAIAAEQEHLGALVSAYLLNAHGVRVAYTLNNGNVVRVQPALDVTESGCDAFLEAFEATLACFARGNIADVYLGLRGLPRPHPGRPRARAAVERRRPLAAHGGEDGRVFAFLYHPPDAAFLAHQDPTIAELTPVLQAEFVRDAAELFDPFVTSRVQLVSRTGARATGVFISIPHTAELLLQLERSDRERIFADCLDLAREHGASVLGLGAYTSIVNDGGTALLGRGFAVTTGNALTAVAGVRRLAAACAARGDVLAGERVAVLGAGGSVGRAAALLAARDAGAVFCLGNPAGGAKARERLDVVLDDICRWLSKWASDRAIAGGGLLARVRQLDASQCRDVAWLRARLIADNLLGASQRLADLASTRQVIAAIGSPRPPILGPELAPDTVLCDLSLPSAASPELTVRRPDVQLVAAGHIALPHSTDVGPFGLPRGVVYACMAETLLATWESPSRDFSVGRDIEFADVLAMEQWSEKHGLRVV
jgi:acetylornithine/succinyldiaminopimelate/putrescine aminotransferase/predicted amino acid dehydrogenase/acyl carrier protein